MKLHSAKPRKRPLPAGNYSGGGEGSAGETPTGAGGTPALPGKLNSYACQRSGAFPIDRDRIHWPRLFVGGALPSRCHVPFFAPNFIAS
jgi:hypothetical protein